MNAPRLLPALLLAVAIPAARAAEQGADEREPPCVQLVKARVARLERSAMMQLQTRLAADSFTRVILAPLTGSAAGGWKWMEGNPFWEEAYALLNPALLAHLLRAGVAELRLQEAGLPPLLDAGTCREDLALTQSKLGALVERLQEALDEEKELARMEKALKVPERLRPWVDRVRAEIREGIALQEDPEVLRDAAQREKVAASLRAADLRYLAALRRLDSTRSPESKKAAKGAGARVVMGQRDALEAIVRRFRAANGEPPQGDSRPARSP